ncbi:MAG: IS6 family transposase [Archaeoglobus sp.]|uniref:IS6 family transposase n=1 Tax=Archaeoglobus sp. TaxID=1872626 RepID=UPI001D31D0D5|nr:IS6 family transposase [Archaeoglobus sp.]MBO8181104.1 IS6 family transposase [Archaeoglobus sp.]
MSKRRSAGIKLLAEGSVMEIEEGKFIVRSGNRNYRVTWSRDKWVCECPDFEKRNKKCKHIYAVMYYLAIKDIKSAVSSLDDRKCLQCGKSDMVIKKGIRYNKSGPVQLYYCKRCKRKFSARTGFSGMKKRADAIVSALDLYFRGLSLRQVAQHLKASYNIQVSHKTVHNWIKRYVRLVNEFVKSVKIESSRWHADETVVKVKGEHIRIWSLLDSETRLVIAVHISKSRGVDEAKKLFENGLEKSSKPDEVVTDGLRSYETAVEQELSDVIRPIFTQRRDEQQDGEVFKELKRRVKSLESFKTSEGAKTFAEGYSIYYNFIKEHDSLDNQTPAQFAGIINNRNWLDLIQRALEAKE